MSEQVILTKLVESFNESRVPGSRLWILDENCLSCTYETLTQIDNLTALTNRFDIASACETAQLPVHFSDFSFADLTDAPTTVFYRISKEKPVTHYILNQCSLLLQDRSQLLIAGRKSEGIKTYFDKAIKQLGFTGTLNKNKDIYTAKLTKVAAVEPQLLDDRDYETKVIVKSTTGIEYHSKPGVYGWNKVDDGSKLLVSQLNGILERDFKHRNIEKIIDLGCGYGYLSIEAYHLVSVFQNSAGEHLKLVATDSNAAAVKMTKENFKSQNISNYAVTADDCGKSLTEKADLLLCNPPFHQGFSVSGDLTKKFVNAAYKLLKKKGKAVFVVNAFIPIEKALAGLFYKVDILENNKQFKVLLLSHS